MNAFSINRLAVVSIRTSKLQETIHFYRDVIGLKLRSHHGHQPAFDLGGGLSLVLLENQADTNRSPCIHRFPVLAFAVDDLDQAVSCLKDHAVEIPWGIESNHGACWVEFYDPGDNLIEFAQFAKQE